MQFIKDTSNRLFHCLFFLCILALLSCTLISSTLQAASKETPSILIIKSKTPALDSIHKGLTDALEEEFDLSVMELSPRSTIKALNNASPLSGITKFLKREDRESRNRDPQAIVLLGNLAIAKYRDYQQHQLKEQKEHNEQKQKNQPPQPPFPPALILGALHAELAKAEMHNVTVIRYEVPIVTSMAKFEDLYSKELKRFGVIYRDWQADRVEKSTFHADSDKTTVVKFPIRLEPIKGNKGKLPWGKGKSEEKAIEQALRAQLLAASTSNLDCLLVTNDNKLINANTLTKVWLPMLKELSIPVMVGVKPLVSSKIGLGSIAVFPNHEDLGRQAADTLYDIADNGWILPEESFELPFSVNTALNLDVLKRHGVNRELFDLEAADTVLR